MSKATVPISEMSHRILQELADQSGQTIVEVLDKAVDVYRRKVFIEGVNAAYAALRADPAAWVEIAEERRSMDGCLMDGRDPKECWGKNGDLLPPGERKADG